jgi:hypothetical protein
MHEVHSVHDPHAAAVHLLRRAIEHLTFRAIRGNVIGYKSYVFEANFTGPVNADAVRRKDRTKNRTHGFIVAPLGESHISTRVIPVLPTVSRQVEQRSGVLDDSSSVLVDRCYLFFWAYFFKLFYLYILPDLHTHDQGNRCLEVLLVLVPNGPSLNSTFLLQLFFLICISKNQELDVVKFCILK